MPVAKKHTTQERKVASIEQHRVIQYRPTIRPGTNNQTRSKYNEISVRWTGIST